MCEQHRLFALDNEGLRAEVSVLRRAVEALPGAWEDSRPPDYAPSLGTIAKGLAAVDHRLAGIETHPRSG
jgi:hypothetical protein